MYEAPGESNRAASTGIASGIGRRTLENVGKTFGCSNRPHEFELSIALLRISVERAFHEFLGHNVLDIR